MPFEIIKSDLASMTADAIIYAQTQKMFILLPFGSSSPKNSEKELLKSRQEAGKLSVGQAKIVPSTMPDTKYIIHTTAPAWHGGHYNEMSQLRSCYENCFQLAVKHQCKSIALPIIAADNSGFSKNMTQEIAFECIHNYLHVHDILVSLAVPAKTGILLPGNQFSAVNTYIDKNYISENAGEELHLSKTTNSSCFPSGNGNTNPSSEYTQTFSETLSGHMARKGMSQSDVYQKANISANALSEILNNRAYTPAKKTVISLGMALNLTLDEIKDFIGHAGYEMTRESKFDLIIEYCISKNIYDVLKVNQIMFRFEQEMLG